MIDTHAHLTFPPLTKDQAGAIARAKDAGVSAIVTIGSGEQEDGNQKALDLAKKHAGYIFAAVGVHPHDAGKLKRGWQARLESLARQGAVALGEMGLDFYRDLSPREKQKDVFRDQLLLARKLDMPVILHVREAREDFVKIIKDVGLPRKGGVWHCFSGTASDVQWASKLGLFISFAGPLTYPKNVALVEAANACPLGMAVVETDCPYLAPQRYRGQTNEPAFVAEVVKKLAEIKSLSIEDVSQITEHSSKRLFDLPGAQWETSIAYQIGNSLYLNVTNRCRLRCTFCPKHIDYRIKGYCLKLVKEPSLEDVFRAIGNPASYDEVVFCGYGEPTVRLELIKEIAKRMKEKGAKKIRLNTDGLANMIEGRDVTVDLAKVIDSVSISMNAPDAEVYARLCPSGFGKKAFEAVLDFVRSAQKNIRDVTVSAVALPEIDIGKCKSLAKELGVKFRERPYQKVG